LIDWKQFFDPMLSCGVSRFRVLCSACSGAFADHTAGMNLQVELVEPPEDSAPGDRVSVQGYEEEPDEQLNPKKKIFEQVTALR